MHTIDGTVLLVPEPPFVWPEPVVTAGQARYESTPPFSRVAQSAVSSLGLVVDLSTAGVEWLRQHLAFHEPRVCCLVVLVYPACPTRAEHLEALDALQKEHASTDRTIDLRVLPVDLASQTSALPPTTLCFIRSDRRRFIGVGCTDDLGCAPTSAVDLNLLFEPEPRLFESWRRWFDLVFARARPLSAETIHIPSLVPARGDPAAARLWEEYRRRCETSPGADSPTEPAVDPTTGEVTVGASSPPTATTLADLPTLDPVEHAVHALYGKGGLVSIDEGSRLKPLDVPVRARLLGGRAVTSVGRVTERRSYTLRVLDETTVAAIERGRNSSDLLRLLSYSLGTGTYWMPEAARPLFERELERRNRAALSVLNTALGGDITTFLRERSDQIRRDLDEMYHQLGRGSRVPEPQMNEILQDVKGRLSAALEGRVAPRISINPLGAPLDRGTESSTAWAQPLRLLLAAARLIRRSDTDPSFRRPLAKANIEEQEFLEAMDVLSDVARKRRSRSRAREELALLDAIEEADVAEVEKCRFVLAITDGGDQEEIRATLQRSSDGATFLGQGSDGRGAQPTPRRDSLYRS